MKFLFPIVLCAMIFIGCEPPKPPALLEKEALEKQRQEELNVVDFNENWKHRSYTYKSSDSLINGNTYLAVYTEIYARTAKKTYPLTATVSIRNTSLMDSIFVNKSEYYDTHGDLVATYFDRTIYVAPMETVEIIIAEDHEQGGSGGNFVFHWSSRNAKIKPLFEAVMISASGQQGISITTHGVDLE